MNRDILLVDREDLERLARQVYWVLNNLESLDKREHVQGLLEHAQDFLRNVLKEPNHG